MSVHHFDFSICQWCPTKITPESNKDQRTPSEIGNKGCFMMNYLLLQCYNQISLMANRGQPAKSVVHSHSCGILLLLGSYFINDMKTYWDSSLEDSSLEDSVVLSWFQYFWLNWSQLVSLTWHPKCSLNDSSMESSGSRLSVPATRSQPINSSSF